MTQRKIVVIGTLHAGRTPTNELQAILEKIRPNQVLVEIAPQDIKKGLKKYPPEMVFAYHWARKQGIDVRGFDSPIQTVRSDVDEKENEKVISEQKYVINDKTWKEMNKAKNLKLLMTPSLQRLVDPKKERKREQEMLQNITATAAKQGIVLILTGCGHLNFLEKHLSNADFPFR